MKLKHISFYHGHKGAVLALAGSAERDFFFSVGATGLIVRWSLKVPDEGEVIHRLQGLVPSMAYDHKSKLLYAALNHKGVVILNADTGKIQDKIPIPSTSFGKVRLTERYILLTTKNGEVLLVEKETLKTELRIETGLKIPPPFALDKKGNKLWYYDSSGFIKMIDLELQKEEKKVLGILDNEIIDLKIMQNNLYALCKQSLHVKNIKKSKSEWFNHETKEDFFLFLLGQEGAPALLNVSENDGIWGFKVDKKGLFDMGNVQNAHNGSINDLLWCENHKFVVTAGSDKTIGVWRFN